MSVLTSGLMLFLLGIFINRPELSMALGGKQASFHLGIFAFGLLYAPFSMMLGILSNKISRKFEYEADAYAAALFDSKSLQEALKKLSVRNLSNLRPHPAYEFVNYSHPTLLKRLEQLKKMEKHGDQ